MVVTTPLITRYRPKSFDQIIGHEDEIRHLINSLESDSCPHAFLLTGGTGVGKTTMARIIGDAVGAEIMEIDAATFSTVDKIREIVEMAQHVSLFGSGARIFIVDECHRLSRQAWDVVLKICEEPPDHLYLAFCTTELRKVPATVVGRCYHIELKPLKRDQLDVLLSAVAEMEGWTVGNDVMAEIVQCAEGSARNGLTILQVAHDVADIEELRRIIRLRGASDNVIALCSLLMSKQGRTWREVSRLAQLVWEEDDWEQASVRAGRYLAKVMVSAQDERAAQHAWTVLDALLFPAQTFDQKAAFFAAVGRVMWSE